MIKKKITHRELCMVAAKYLRNKGLHKFHRCKYSVCELILIGECPDAFGWCSSSTQMMEVKTNRPDFLRDKKKPWRQRPEIGMGEFRSYICPEGVIKEDELPPYWGLIYVDSAMRCHQIVEAQRQVSNRYADIAAINSVMRREGVKAGVYSYIKYKNG